MLDSFALRFQKYAPLLLRLGLAIVFFLFGLKKLANSGQVTSEIQLVTNLELADAAAINYYMGIAEIICAIALFVGFKVRMFALIASLLVLLFFLSFLFKFGASLNPDLYRDVGLLGASLSLFLLGAGPASLDQSGTKQKTEA